MSEITNFSPFKRPSGSLGVPGLKGHLKGCLGLNKASSQPYLPSTKTQKGNLIYTLKCSSFQPQGGGGGTLGISGWGCAAETLEPLLPIPELVQLNFATLYTRVNSPKSPYPRVAVCLV